MPPPSPGAGPLPGSQRSPSSPARGSFWPWLRPLLRPPRAGCTAPAHPLSGRLSARRTVVCLPSTSRPSSQERGCRCCRWSGWAPPLPLLVFPGLLVASAPAAAAAACDSPPPFSFFSFCLSPLSPVVRARGLHGLLWQELSRVCACECACLESARALLALGVEEEKEPKRRRRRGAWGRAMKLSHARSCRVRPAS